METAFSYDTMLCVAKNQYCKFSVAPIFLLNLVEFVLSFYSFVQTKRRKSISLYNNSCTSCVSFSASLFFIAMTVNNGYPKAQDIFDCYALCTFCVLVLNTPTLYLLLCFPPFHFLCLCSVKIEEVPYTYFVSLNHC